jgi:hypothetical protein
MSRTMAAIPTNRRVYLETLIHIIECANCNIDFGIGDDFMTRRRDDHEVFYCPNGHQNFYTGQSRAEKAEAALKRAEARALSWRDQAEVAERARRAQKGANTKLKKRIAAGVCPCCKRSFVNVARHMAGQHPDYTTKDAS